MFASEQDARRPLPESPELAPFANLLAGTGGEAAAAEESPQVRGALGSGWAAFSSCCSSRSVVALQAVNKVRGNHVDEV